MNIYVTGGHLTPALAVVDVLRKKEGINIYFIGRENMRDFPPQPSHEQREIEERGLPFFPIQAAKFHREHFWLNLLEVIKFPISFFQVLTLFSKRKPDGVLSFGGYIALPVCLVAKLFGARVVTHEQTRVAGLANQVIALIADVVALSHDVSLRYFPKNKTVVTGNPIRESLFKEYKVPPTWFPESIANQPFIYVTGGSQGSQVINHTLLVLLPKILRHFVIVHQCGIHSHHTYRKELEKFRDSLPTGLKMRYFVREWIEAKEVSYLMRHAKFVISRAGANTVQELTLSGTPAIFIPLSFAYQNEQEKNARDMVNAGAAIMILQKDLYPNTLYDAILRVNRRFESMKAKALILKDQLMKNGAENVAELILEKNTSNVVST